MSAVPAVLGSPSIVARKVDLPLDSVMRRAEGGFALVSSAPVRTYARTDRLRFPGMRLVKFARVEVEVSEYSASACLVEVRPVSANWVRWGKWRFARYFGRAHRAADELAAALGQVSVQLAA